MTEDQARAVLLLQSFEVAGEGPQWTAEDRQWASRAATQALGAGAGREAWIVERARLALQRLAPRDAGVRTVLARRVWQPAWPAMALVGGVLAGVVSDALVAGPYFNLLAPLLWGLVAWNLALYLWLAAQGLRRRPPGALRRSLAHWLLRVPVGTEPMRRFGGRWAEVSLPLSTARVALLLHLAAAGMAVGLIAGLLLRGLVFDYRAGWATTLLQPDTVRTALAWLLAPAHAVAGLAAPDAATFAALRVLPGQPAQASAAPWIVLMSVQLALLVVLPRVMLAGAAALQTSRLAAGFPLPLTGPDFGRLLPGIAPCWWVLPHARSPQPAAVLGLRALLARVWGDVLVLQIAAPLPHGDEDRPPAAPAGSRALLLVDLTATPEIEVHGRLVAALAAAGTPALLLVDEAAFVRRFGAGQRLEQRRAAWSSFGPCVLVDLESPDLAPAEAALRRLLAD
jgi:hypothetical protein